MRKQETPWEHKLWQHLRANRFYSLQFKRQTRLGNYIADFYCASKKVIIELDGGHHNREEFQQVDDSKEKYFESLGYRVLRFWNNEVDTNFNGVLEKIREVVLFKTPPALQASSPRQERE